MIIRYIFYKKLYLTAFLFAFTFSFLQAQCPTLFVPGDTTIACSAIRTLYTQATVPVFNVTTTTCSPVTLSSPTTAFPTACDDCVTGQIPIGFSFSFFGTPYTTAVIQSNGIVGFGAFTFTGYSSFSIPALGTPNNYIAGLFADIDIRYGGTITYQTVGTAPNRRFVVSYNNVVPYNFGVAGTGTASFQIILNENGTFNVAISQLSNNWNAATSDGFITSGAENADGTIAIAVPGRNAADIGGIVPGDQDCRLFQPVNCLFQNWSIGGTVISTNNIFNVSPTVNTTYTVTWSCAGSPCTRNTVVTVATPPALSVTIAGTPTPVCTGSSITFTATPANQGAGPTYQWTKNGTNISGAAAITYTGIMGTDFVVGDLIRCVVTRPASACSAIQTVTSSAFTIAAFVPLAVTVTINSTSSPSCVGDNVTFTATPANQGASPIYQWTKNGTNISGANAITYTGITGTDFINGDLIRCVVTRPSDACGAIFTVTSSAFTVVVSSPPAVTSATVCQNGTSVAMTSGACGVTSAPIAQGAVFNSGNLSATDARWTRNVSGTTCGATATPDEYYDIFAFTVSTAGSYTFNMCHVGATWDSHASLYQNAFNPASPCDVPSNFIIANDDGNASCSSQSQLIATLSTGVTYYLISTSFFGNETGVNYQWTFTGPGGATISAPVTNVVQWYTAPTGGSPIGTGTSFNPVGVAGSGLANTATVATTTYYVACSASPACRVAVNYVIQASTTPTVSITPTSTTTASTTFTATASNTNGGTVTYTFRKNGTSQQTGASNTWNATGLVNGDNITCDISIAGGTCLAITTATSNTAPVVFWTSSPDIYRGNMISFPGVNGQISMSNAANIASRDFSIEFWFRLGDVPTAPLRTMFSMGSVNNDNEKLTIEAGNNNEIRVNFGNTNNTYTWTHTAGFHHLVVTYNQTTKLEELFVDGNLIASNTRTADYLGNRNMVLGNRQNGANRFFKGNLEEIRIWNEVRTRNQIRENMHLTQTSQGSLIGYYQSNESLTPSALLDRVSASNGTFAGDAVRVVSSVSVGGGASKRTNILSPIVGAEFTLPTTNMEIDFNAVIPNGELVVTQITAETPYNNQFYSITSCYWIVRNFGANLTGLNFNNMRFQIPASDNILATDVTTPANLKLFKRQHNAESAWVGTSAATSANNVTKNIVFSSFLTASFSEFVIGSIGNVLPEQIFTLSGKRENEKQISLHWKTQIEIPIKTIEIEQLNENKIFEKIALAPLNVFTTTVENTKGGIFRIKQIMQDGQVFYTNIVQIEGTIRKISIYPNPTDDKITIELEDLQQNAQAELFDAVGKKIWEGVLNNEKTEISLASFAKGLYVLKLYHNQKRTHHKIILK